MYKADYSKQKKPTDYSIELVVYYDEEDQIKEVFELNIGNNIIGSSAKDCTLVINKPEVEKKHLQIEIELDDKTNFISPQIQSLKSESGTQKKLKDGNFTNILPGKWTLMGNLATDYIFYIAKKYKCIVRKVPKSSKLHMSFDGGATSSNQNSNTNPVAKINFLKSLDNIDGMQQSVQKLKDKFETSSDIVLNASANKEEKQPDTLSKPKMFGKNFKPKNQPAPAPVVDAPKSLNTKFKSPSLVQGGDNQKQGQETAKLSDSKNRKIMEVEELQKSPAQKSIENSDDKKARIPVVSLQIPQGNTKTATTTPLSSKSKGIESKQQQQNKDQTMKNETEEEKVDAKGKIKKAGKSKKNEQLDVSLDLSLEMSDDGKKKQNIKQMISHKDNKESLKIVSTDDEDEEDKLKAKQQPNKNAMISEEDELKNKKKNNDKNVQDKSLSVKQGKGTAAASTKQFNKEAKEDKKPNNKRKAKDAFDDSKSMDIEDEAIKNNDNQKTGFNDAQKVQTVAVQSKGGLKSTLAQNSIAQKKRKLDEPKDDADKQKLNDMKEENKVKESKVGKIEDKLKVQDNKKGKENLNKMEDENKPIVDDKKTPNKAILNNKAQALQQEKNKKPSIKNEDPKELKKVKNEGQKLGKASKNELKKQEKKKEVKKVSEKRNSIVKNSLEVENEESEEEQTYVINSDGEEEYVLKGHSASKQSTSKAKKFNVLFSNCAFDQTDGQDRLSKLGVRVMKNLQSSFNVLIMDDFTRRAKTLVALNKGAKIISSQWILDCIYQEKVIEDLDKYEIKVDKEFSKKHKFNLKEVQQRNASQLKPIFQDIKFILPEEEIYQNIVREDLEHIIMTAGGSIIHDDECDDIQDKSNIKVIFDNDQSDPSHQSPDKNSSKSHLSESKKKNQIENKQKLQYAYKKNNFDCVLIESIFQSCLHQKICNWSDFEV